MTGRKKLTTTERALRGLVFEYLSRNCPKAARLFEAQAMLDDFETGTDADPSNKDEYMVAAETAIVATFGEGATLQTVLARGKKAAMVAHVPAAGKKVTPRATPKAQPKKAPVPPSSDDDEVAAAPAVRKVSPKAAPAKKPVPPTSDSDDDESAKKPTAQKPASRKPSPKAAPVKKALPPRSDSDDDDAPAKKPAPKAAAKAVVKPTPASDSDDDDVPKKPAPKAAVAKPVAKKPAVESDSDDEPPKTKKPSPKAAPKKAPIADSDDDEAPKPAKKASPKAAPQKPAVIDSDDEAPRDDKKAPAPVARAPPAPKKQPGERFCRIDVNSVKFTHDALRDNTCRNDVSSFTQNAKMLAVRGKEFNKHKQKNKAKLYAAGVDMGVHSFKFDEDE